MRSLLDVNVLLALHDPNHTHTEIAHEWWEEYKNTGWASCPISENGFVRVSSGPNYSPRLQFTPFESANILRDFANGNDHEFWPDSICIFDTSIFSLDRVVGPRQLTDVYMLGLAMRNKGRLVTFDRRIPLSAVIRATDDNIVILDDR
ncbi:MAG TPA: TA system VapC family ribonuclease toxin [Pyrinomonadaceae bacterium]|nr:TA system VapC family ribonuclease toxin [Pyrinomonadaceae bacterium]